MTVSQVTSAGAGADRRTSPDGFREYIGSIRRAIVSTFEGLAVTSSWLFRRPITIQYPDRMEKPVQEQLPHGYRGVLEVDLLRCSGCLLCARACPIDCIAIKIEKNKASGVREIVQFDIDVGKCMFCGLCVEVCKFDSIDHTPEFEATTDAPGDLVLRFAETPSPVSKQKEGEGTPRRPLGSILTQISRRAGDRPRWGGLEPAPATATDPAESASQTAPAVSGDRKRKQAKPAEPAKDDTQAASSPEKDPQEVSS